ncbi:MAG: alkaline phosphatase, partial [Ramlibacter sp.]|nr:alkaline phosphatase [Ramlibacter sp.]
MGSERLASYEFTNYIDGAVPAFDPDTDLLTFADGFTATGLSLAADGADTLVWHGGQSVRLTGVLPTALDGTQFSFQDGSLFRQGTAGPNRLVGSAQADQFDLSEGGTDTVSAGDGDDVVRLGENILSDSFALDGGTGGGDELHLGGRYQTEVRISPGAGVITGFERIVIDAGSRVMLDFGGTVFPEPGHALTFDATALGADDGFHLKGGYLGSSILALGGLGADTLSGSYGNDTIDGGEGADMLYGGEQGDDMITGGGGNDTLSAGFGNGVEHDTMSGGDGDDVFWVYGGYSDSAANAAVLTGGAGVDTYLFSAPGYDILRLGRSTVAGPARITDFNLAEGDRLVSGFQDGRTAEWSGWRTVIWRGDANPLFRAVEGEDVRLAGAEADGRFVEFWTVYDAEADQTILYADRNRDLKVDANDLKIIFDGHVALSPEIFSDNTLLPYQVGTSGADTDTRSGLTAAADTAFAFDGDDTLAGLGGNDRLNGDGGRDNLSGGSGHDSLFGGAGSDELAGDEGADALFGGLGADTLWGGEGNDILDGAGPRDSLGYSESADGDANILHGGSGNDTLKGSTGGDLLWGDGDNDTLTGFHGDDTLQGGDGADLLEGGMGNDSLLGGGGNDTLRGASTDTSLPGTDILDGGEGDDLLVSGRETGVMTGGGGADLFGFNRSEWDNLFWLGLSSVGNPGRITDFNMAEGDRIHTNLTEGLVDYSPVVWRGAAGAGFTATEGQSVLLAGGDPDEEQILELWTAYDAAADQTVLFMDLDRNFVVDAYDLKIVFDGEVALTVECLSEGSVVARRGTDGADDATTLAPTPFDDILLAAGGDDTVRGAAGNDRIYGNDGSDVLIGNDGDDVLEGAAGDDALYGGAGSDHLRGGAGSDTLMGGEGRDFLLAGTEGAPVHNELGGGGGNDYLVGGGGDDLLHGDAGDDHLIGFGGDDTLDGGAGWNRLEGQAGNDTYVVRSRQTFTIEEHLQGTDTVLTTLLRYTLESGIERGVILSESGARLTGNDLANHLTGAAGDDTLDGSLGSDTLAGGAGNDSYYVDDPGDKVVETDPVGGTDRVIATVTFTLTGETEQLQLSGTDTIDGIGNGLANLLAGNHAANMLSGQSGDDTLLGGGGSDRLRGGDGADLFLFERALESRNAARDLVVDFMRGVDRIDLGALDADATAFGQQHFTFIGSASFGA